MGHGVLASVGGPGAGLHGSYGGVLSQVPAVPPWSFADYSQQSAVCTEWPLQRYLAKAVFHFVIHAESHTGLLGMVVAWVRGLES